MSLRSHGVCVGMTQSGKTTLCVKWLGKQKGLKIFVNTKRQKEWRAFAKYRIEKPSHMTELYKNYKVHSSSPHIFLIEPDVTDSTATDKIGEIFDVILKYHQDYPNRYNTFIFIDEIQVFQSKFTRSESFARLWTMGLGLGIKAVAIAQRPQLINNDILYNSDTWVIMRVTKSDMEYLDEKGIIEYEPEKHTFAGKYDAYIQDNKKVGLVKLKQ